MGVIEMTPMCCQESAATFSAEDWMTVPVGEDGIFLECKVLDFARKRTPDWPRPRVESVESDSTLPEADRDIQAGRIKIFDSAEAMLADLRTLHR